MSGTATLAIVPPAEPSAPAPDTPLLGLPMIRRTALAARRAGFDHVVVAGATEEIRRALEGTGAECPAGAPVPRDAKTLPWNVVVATQDLRELLAGGDARSVGIAVPSRKDLPRAETYLLDGLVKDTEGFMSRHFERRISLAVSRLLAATSVTPNAMTLISVGIGLAGSIFFLSQRSSLQTIGALLFLAHSILDGCDGELARLKLQESRFGGLLDFWGDNVVHSAVFGAIAVGWSRTAGADWPLGLGAAAIAGTLLSASFVYWTTMRSPREGPLYTSVAASGETRLSRIADALSRRDFIYLVLALSLFGKASWFLVLAAVGAPIFFLVLLAIHAREKPVSRSAT